MSLEKQAALFGYFSLRWQEKLAEELNAQELAQMTELMPHDERADLLTPIRAWSFSIKFYNKWMRKIGVIFSV
ncbi:magnesium transporter MgtE N-terminal domain-containing protein [Vibrio metschnikovii]